MKYKIMLVLLLFLFLPCIANAATFNFTDVRSGSYYFDAVCWAVENDISNGTGNNKFSPNQVCSKAQFLLFLWRSNGAPEPGIANPFNNNVIETYYKPALWAYEKGFISGPIFNSTEICDLETLVNSLWYNAGRPGKDAFTWAVNNGLNLNTGINTYSKYYSCNRGQVITFLYRCDKLKNGDKESDNFSDTENKQNSYDNWQNDELSVKTSLSKSMSLAGGYYNLTFRLTAYADGGSGDYQYKFELIQNNKTTNLADWSENNTISNTLSGNGSCEIRVSVQDADGEEDSVVVDLLNINSGNHKPDYNLPNYDNNDYDDDYDDNDNESDNQELAIGFSQSGFKSIAGSNYSIDLKLAAYANGGTGDYQYRFEIIQNGEITNSNDWSQNNAISSRLNGSGSCEVRIWVKDTNGTTVSQLVDLLRK